MWCCEFIVYVKTCIKKEYILIDTLLLGFKYATYLLYVNT